jgi:hypothetical protein
MEIHVPKLFIFILYFGQFTFFNILSSLIAREHSLQSLNYEDEKSINYLVDCWSGPGQLKETVEGWSGIQGVFQGTRVIKCVIAGALFYVQYFIDEQV